MLSPSFSVRLSSDKLHDDVSGLVTRISGQSPGEYVGDNPGEHDGDQYSVSVAGELQSDSWKLGLLRRVGELLSNFGFCGGLQSTRKSLGLVDFDVFVGCSNSLVTSTEIMVNFDELEVTLSVLADSSPSKSTNRLSFC